MVLAHGFPLATSDIDAVPKGMDIATLDLHVKAVARKRGVGRALAWGAVALTQALYYSHATDRAAELVERMGLGLAYNPWRLP